MEQRMAILGCGYLGSELARQALSKGFRVVALTRNPATAEALRKLGVQQVMEAELDDDSWHEAVNSDQDYVVNCVGSAGGGLQGYAKSYLDGQGSVARWMKKGRVGTFLYTSSVSVYPQMDGQLVDETFSCEGTSDRGALLLASESVCFPGPASIERSFVLRLAGIYGPQRHIYLNHLRAGAREIPGDGEAFLNLIHRDDACAAIWAVLSSSSEIPGRIYNLSDGHPVPRKELVEWLARRLGVDVPPFTGIPLSRTGADPTQPLPNRKIDNLRIREEVSWEPCYPSFREGYADLLGDAS